MKLFLLAVFFSVIPAAASMYLAFTLEWILLSNNTSLPFYWILLDYALGGMTMCFSVWFCMKDRL